MFCKRWQDMGGAIYADINIPLTHTGTHSFAGNFAISNNFKPREQPPTLTQQAKAAQQEPSITVTRDPTAASKEEAPPTKLIPPQPSQITSLSEAKSVAPMRQRISPDQVGMLK